MTGVSATTWVAAAAIAALCASAHAAEQVTLRNGFDLTCDHRAPAGANGQRVRLYMDADGASFLEVNASDIVSDELLPAPPPAPAVAPVNTPTAPPPVPAKLSDAELKPILSRAGATYDIDSDLLASVIRQESGGQTHAVSRAGAEGLMQLMPGTAAELGVDNSFAPSENVRGGTAYLDELLRRYHEDVKLALAAYNAGPAAVDRWHGIPPYAETRAYVARVIHEYNRRVISREAAASRSMSAGQ